MANEIKLEIYTIAIREKRNRDYIKLDEVWGNDFFDVFRNYIEDYQNNLYVNDEIKKSIQFDTEHLTFATRRRLISGIVESGDYGVESKIVNKESKEVKYNKLVDDLDIKPFYFLLHLPIDSTKGFLVLQRLGIYGINTVFSNHLSFHIKESFPDLILDFAPFVSKRLTRLFLEQGNIQEIKLRRFNIPSDIIDRLGMADYEDNVQSIEIKINAKTNSFLGLNDKVSRFIDDPNTAFFDIPQLRQLGFDGDNESKIKVQYGNNSRTIDLSDTGQIRPYYDINEEVVKQANGHPLFSSIDGIAKGYLQDILNEINNEE